MIDCFERKKGTEFGYLELGTLFEWDQRFVTGMLKQQVDRKRPDHEDISPTMDRGREDLVIDS
jgi:hypothetical protein